MLELTCNECERIISLDEKTFNELMDTTRAVYCLKGHRNALMTLEEENKSLKAKIRRLSEQNERLITEVERLLNKEKAPQNPLQELREPSCVPTDTPEEEEGMKPTSLVIDVKNRHVILDGVGVCNREDDNGKLKWTVPQIFVMIKFANNCRAEFAENEFSPSVAWPWKMIKAFVEPINDLFIRVGGKKYLDLEPHQVTIINE